MNVFVYLLLTLAAVAGAFGVGLVGYIVYHGFREKDQGGLWVSLGTLGVILVLAAYNFL